MSRIIVNDTMSKKMYFNGIPFWSVGHFDPATPDYHIRYTTTDNNQLSISSSIITNHTFVGNVGDITLNTTEVPARFFESKTTLKTLSYGNNLTFNIGGYQHSGCTGLESVVLPSNLTMIPQRLFRTCSKLGRVDIPASVTTWSRAWPFYYAGSQTPNETVDVYVHNATSLPTIDTYGGGEDDYDFYITANHGTWGDINIENLIRLHVPSDMYESYISTAPHSTVSACISSY